MKTISTKTFLGLISLLSVVSACDLNVPANSTLQITSQPATSSGANGNNASSPSAPRSGANGNNASSPSAPSNGNNVASPPANNNSGNGNTTAANGNNPIGLQVDFSAYEGLIETPQGSVGKGVKYITAVLVDAGSVGASNTTPHAVGKILDDAVVPEIQMGGPGSGQPIVNTLTWPALLQPQHNYVLYFTVQTNALPPVLLGGGTVGLPFQTTADANLIDSSLSAGASSMAVNANNVVIKLSNQLPAATPAGSPFLLQPTTMDVVFHVPAVVHVGEASRSEQVPTGSFQLVLCDDVQNTCSVNWQATETFEYLPSADGNMPAFATGVFHAAINADSVYTLYAFELPILSRTDMKAACISSVLSATFNEKVTGNATQANYVAMGAWRGEAPGTQQFQMNLLDYPNVVSLFTYPTAAAATQACNAIYPSAQ